ncbi:unnamed protein product [Alopecurus aequalis]
MASAVACKGPEMASLVKKMLTEPAASGAPVVADAGDRRLVRDFTVPSYFSQDVASKGPEMASLVKKLLAEPSASGALVDADAGDRRLARHFTVPSFFPQDVLDLSGSGAPTSLGGMLALTAPGRGWSVAKEDDEAVYLKVPMPGLGKEHVKVSAEQNSVVIKGEGEKDPWHGDKDNAPVARYSRRIDLPAGAYKMDKIKAEMKDGVLRVTVPKVKEEERKDVFQVQVE